MILPQSPYWNVKKKVFFLFQNLQRIRILLKNMKESVILQKNNKQLFIFSFFIETDILSLFYSKNQ